MRIFHSGLRVWLVALAAIASVWWPTSANAAEVSARLSSSNTSVGVPVQLEIRMRNVRQAEDPPQAIAADGLEIQFSGTSKQFEMRNFQTSSTLTYLYTIVPTRPGTFTVPSVSVVADGQRFRTPPLPLRVAGGGQGGQTRRAPQVQQFPPGFPPPMIGIPGLQQQQQIIPPPAPPGSAGRRPSPQMPQGSQPPMPPLPDPDPGSGALQPPPDSEGSPYFGELVMGSRSAYVGEVIPVQLRYFFRADAQFDQFERPVFAGEGFTSAKLGEPVQSSQDIDGIPYNVLTFQSSITPVKSGTLEIPSATLNCRMVTADQSGIDPFFNQFFQNFPIPGIPGMGRAEAVGVETTPRTLEVKPLPKEGRPDDFSGAIGQFTLKGAATPRKAAAGEPVTLTLTVEGRGNFDAMAPPVLTGDDGWRSYPPKENFEAADSIGYGGKKTFETMLVARTTQTKSPGAKFSYFDPNKAKFVTLTFDPVPLQAEGSGQAAEEAAAPAAAPTPAAGPAPTFPADDIAPPSTALAGGWTRFHPWLLAPWFHGLNLLLALLVIGAAVVLILLRRAARKDPLTVANESALRQARQSFQQATDRAALHAAAARMIQARLALRRKEPLELVNPREALASLPLEASLATELESILLRADELRYAGLGSGAVEPAERSRVQQTLAAFEKNHG